MAISDLEATVECAVERIEARLDRFEARLDRFGERIEAEVELLVARDIAEHRKTREFIDKYHRRTVLIVLGGLAVATAILAIVIAVT